MGLLDEAIRDHLDLKRRRGADPGEIAREEREALEPVFPDEPRAAPLADEPQALVADPEPPQGDPLAQAAAHAGGQPLPAQAAEVSALAQETAELDMEAVMEQDERLTRDAAPAAGGASAVDAAPAAHGEATIEDELIEWEDPEHAIEPPPEPLPGQERLSFE
jgi:hypothetical protein